MYEATMRRRRRGAMVDDVDMRVEAEADAGPDRGREEEGPCLVVSAAVGR